MQCSHLILTFLGISSYFLLRFAIAVLNVQEYCDKFPDNLRPIICILRENQLVPRTSSSTPKPGRVPWSPSSPWDEWESEEEEEEPVCGCEVTCFPRPDGVNTSEEIRSNLDCRPCGNNCDVTTSVNPRCSCAAVGSGLSSAAGRKNQRCNCSVTCARTPAMDTDPFCIFNITGLQSIDDPRPVNCECCKSKLAEHSDYPDFVCICQRV